MNSVHVYIIWSVKKENEWNSVNDSITELMLYKLTTKKKENLEICLVNEISTLTFY